MTEISTSAGDEQGLFSPLIRFFQDAWGPAWEGFDPELRKLGGSDESDCIQTSAPKAFDLAQQLKSLENAHMETIAGLIRAVDLVNAAYEQIGTELDKAHSARLTDSVELGTDFSQFGECVASAAELLAPLRHSPADSSMLVKACRQYDSCLSAISPDVTKALGPFYRGVQAVGVSRNEVMHLALASELLVHAVVVQALERLNDKAADQRSLNAIANALSALTSEEGVVAGVIAVLAEIRADPPAAYDIEWLNSTYNKFIDFLANLRPTQARVIHRIRESSRQMTVTGSSLRQNAARDGDPMAAQTVATTNSSTPSSPLQPSPLAAGSDLTVAAETSRMVPRDGRTKAPRLRGPRPLPPRGDDSPSDTDHGDQSPLIADRDVPPRRGIGQRVLGGLTKAGSAVTAPFRFMKNRISRLLRRDRHLVGR